MTRDFELFVQLTLDAERADGTTMAASLHDIDWSAVMELAARHRVEALVATTLQKRDDIRPPTDVSQHFAGRLRDQVFHSLSLTKTTVEIVRTLKDLGIPSVVLKGPAIANRFYQAAHARHSKDIDILIPAAQRAAAQDAVEGIGFEKSDLYRSVPSHSEGTLEVLSKDVVYLRPSDNSQLELHWRLDRNTKFIDWDFETSQEFHTTLNLAGTAVTVLNPAAQFIYLICHGAKDAWFRLKWLADIVCMVRRMSAHDVADVARLAERTGSERVLATSLLFIKEHAGMALEAFDDRRITRHDLPLLRVHMRRSLLKDEIDADKGTADFDLRCELQTLHYLMQLKRGLGYKAAVLWYRFANVGNIGPLGLSDRWIWLQPIAGPALAVSRILGRRAKSQTERHEGR